MLKSIFPKISVTLAVLLLLSSYCAVYAASVTREIAENSPRGTNIGDPVTVTNATRYSLGGVDLNSFSLDSTGQLKVKSPLDYETKNKYHVIVHGYSAGPDGAISTADDVREGAVNVTINITDVTGTADVQPTPQTSSDTLTTREIAENSSRGTNIGDPVTITNAVLYRLGGADVTSFSIDSSTGQLKVKDHLDYETKKKYHVTVHGYDATDARVGGINVIINVTDLNDPPKPPIRLVRRSQTFSLTQQDQPVGSVTHRPYVHVGTVSQPDATAYKLAAGTDTKFRSSSTGRLEIRGSYVDTVGSHSVTINAYNGAGQHIAVISVTVRIVAPVPDPPTPPSAVTTQTLAKKNLPDHALSGNISRYPASLWTAGDYVYNESIAGARTYRLGGPDAGSGILRIETVPVGGPKSEGIDYQGQIFKGRTPTKEQYSYTVEAFRSDGAKLTTRQLIVNVKLRPNVPAATSTDSGGSSIDVKLPANPNPPSSAERKPRMTFRIDSDKVAGDDVGRVSVAGANRYEFKATYRDETYTDEYSERQTNRVAVYESDADFFTFQGRVRDVFATSVTLKVAGHLSKSSYAFTINAYSSGTHIAIVPVTVTVRQLPPAPQSGDLTWTIAENEPAGTFVSNSTNSNPLLSKTQSIPVDPSNPQTAYRITTIQEWGMGGTDQDAFELVVESNGIRVKSRRSFDYETKKHYSIVIFGWENELPSPDKDATPQLTGTIGQAPYAATALIMVTDVGGLAESAPPGQSPPLGQSPPPESVPEPPGSVPEPPGGGTQPGDGTPPQQGEATPPQAGSGAQTEASSQTPTNTVSLEVSDVEGLNIESPPDAQPAEQTELYDPDGALNGGLSEENKMKAIWRLYTKADTTEKILYYVIARTTRAANQQMSWVHSGDSKTYSEQEAAAEVALGNIENHAEWKLVLGTPGTESPFADAPGAPMAVARKRFKRELRQPRQLQHTFTDVIRDVIPKKTALLANYPNPFNPETWIPYHLAKATKVTLHIYAGDGTRVRTLSLGHQAAGIYKNKSRAAYWDGKNALGEPVSSGVYFYTLTAGDFTATRKLLILK